MTSMKSAPRIAAIRRLVEEWGVPVPTISVVSGLAESTIGRLIDKDDWVPFRGPADLQNELMVVFRKYLKTAEKNDEICPEKSARALGVLAKTLESIMAMNVRLTTAQKKTIGETPSNAKSADNADFEKEGFASEAQRTAHLDEEFAQLLKGLGKS